MEECGHVKEALSAFLDGKAENAEAIRRHLQFCESCARHHMQLKKISARLHALPDPEPDPAFTARVMSRVASEVAENGPQLVSFPAARLKKRFHAALAVAALLLFAAGTVYLLYPGSVEAPTMPETPAVALQASFTSDDDIVNEMERLLEQGSDMTAFELAAWEQPLPEYFLLDTEDPDTGADIGFDDIVDLLIVEDAGVDEAAAIPGEDDLFGMIGRLDQEEEAWLRDMLRVWLEDGTV